MVVRVKVCVQCSVTLDTNTTAALTDLFLFVVSELWEENLQAELDDQGFRCGALGLSADVA